MTPPTRPGDFHTSIDRDIMSGRHHVIALHRYLGEPVWSTERQQFECAAELLRVGAEVDTLDAAERVLSEWIAERISATSLSPLTNGDK